eukprot:7383850-Prymnesium_polylepis.3
MMPPASELARQPLNTDPTQKSIESTADTPAPPRASVPAFACTPPPVPEAEQPDITQSDARSMLPAPVTSIAPPSPTALHRLIVQPSRSAADPLLTTIAPPPAFDKL